MTEPQTRTPVRTVLGWAALWVGLYEAAQLVGLLINAALVAVNFNGIADDIHADDVQDYVIQVDIRDMIPPTLLVLLIPGSVAVGILWIFGRHLGAMGFRVLSLVVFLAWSPIHLVYWGTEYFFQTWLVATLAIALTIRPPKRPSPSARLREPRSGD